MNYTAADVKKLREETGATFADCKKAFEESENWKAAVKWLEVRNGRKAEKMVAAGRETKEGGIFSYIHHNKRVGALVELNCTTDFVARSESFTKLANDLSLQIVGMAPAFISREDVSEEALAAFRAELGDDVSDAEVEKALASKILLQQPFVRDGSQSISDLLRKAIAETGENIVIRRFSRFALGE
jgi:elongation factor Ts